MGRAKAKRGFAGSYRADDERFDHPPAPFLPGLVSRQMV